VAAAHHQGLRLPALATVRGDAGRGHGGVALLARAERSGGAADGKLSPDLQRYWHDALSWMLAAYLAVDASLPPDKVATLGGIAETKKRDCLRFSREHTGNQMVLRYPTQWSA
jgi:hypothetical protein